MQAVSHQKEKLVLEEEVMTIVPMLVILVKDRTVSHQKANEVEAEVNRMELDEVMKIIPMQATKTKKDVDAVMTIDPMQPARIMTIKQ